LIAVDGVEPVVTITAFGGCEDFESIDALIEPMTKLGFGLFAIERQMFVTPIFGRGFERDTMDRGDATVEMMGFRGCGDIFRLLIGGSLGRNAYGRKGQR
jgi:hypothetical protein